MLKYNESEYYIDVDFMFAGKSDKVDLDLNVPEDDTWISKGSFMQTKHLFVLINIWTMGEVGTMKLV